MGAVGAMSSVCGRRASIQQIQTLYDEVEVDLPTSILETHNVMAQDPPAISKNRLFLPRLLLDPMIPRLRKHCSGEK